MPGQAITPNHVNKVIMVLEMVKDEDGIHISQTVTGEVMDMTRGIVIPSIETSAILPANPKKWKDLAAKIPAALRPCLIEFFRATVGEDHE